MVEQIKDERTAVIIDDNKVEFKHENVQMYTKEQARNVLVSFKKDLKEKQEYIEKFNKILDETMGNAEENIQKIVDSLKAKYPKLSIHELLAYKKITLLETGSELRIRLNQIKKDIPNIKEGIEIWKVAEDFEPTAFEKKLLKNE